jgi:hypothetical protein
MDAMMTAKGDVWDPPEEVIGNCNREVDETIEVGVRSSLKLDDSNYVIEF